MAAFGQRSLAGGVGQGRQVSRFHLARRVVRARVKTPPARADVLDRASKGIALLSAQLALQSQKKSGVSPCEE